MGVRRIIREVLSESKLMTEVTERSFLDWLSMKLGKKIGIKLGSGASGAVFDIGNAVIKISRNNSLDQASILNKNIPGTVRIYANGKIKVPKKLLTKQFGTASKFVDIPMGHILVKDSGFLYYLIMEKVQVDQSIEHDIEDIMWALESYFDDYKKKSSEDSVLRELFEKRNDEEFIKDFAKFLRDNYTNSEKSYNEHLETLAELIGVFRNVGKYFDWMDIHSGQFGRNSNGELVAFDLDNSIYKTNEFVKHTVSEEVEITDVNDDGYWDRVKIVAKNKYGKEVGFAVLDMAITPESEFAFMDDEHAYTDEEIEEHFPEDFAAKLEHLEVYSKYRKKGFGKELMDAVVKYVKSRDYKTLYLIAYPIGIEPKISLDDLSKFYSSYGFKVIKDFDNAHDMVSQLRERELIHEEYVDGDSHVYHTTGSKDLDNNIYIKDIDSSYDNEVYDLINNEFISNGTSFIGLFDEDEIIGAILLEKDYLPYEYRFDIIIDSYYRKKGYANLLIKELIKKFKEDSKAENLIAWVVNGDLKNMLVNKYNFDTWKYEGEDFVGLQKDNINEIRKIVRNTILESSKQQNKSSRCLKKDIPEYIIKYLSKFNSDEELLRSGGIPIDMLDKWAFGFTENEVKSIMPDKLKIRWHDDLDNVKWEIDNTIWEKNNEKGTKENWAKHINLSNPIDVSFLENEDDSLERGFYVEDGHHRYYAASILGKPLNINLQIKANPIKELSNLGYDEFHRCVFNEANNIREAKKIIRKFLKESKDSDVWYHGTPDVRDLEKEGGFTEKIMSVEYIDDINAFEKLQDELIKSRESEDGRYFKLLDMVPKLKKQFKMRKPIFLTNDMSVARTYANPKRAFDYQGAVEKILKVKVKKGHGVEIVATGDRFRFIDTDKVRRGFLNAGVGSEEFEEVLNKFTFYLNNKKGIKTDMVAAIGEWFGFDYIDVIGVLDSYNGGSIKSTVRMVFNPGDIEIIK